MERTNKIGLAVMNNQSAKLVTWGPEMLDIMRTIDTTMAKHSGDNGDVFTWANDELTINAFARMRVVIKIFEEKVKS